MVVSVVTVELVAPAAPVAQAESRWQQVLPLNQMVVTVVTVELVAPAAMAAMAAMLPCMATTKVSLMVAMAETVRQLAAQVELVALEQTVAVEQE
jgi:hypothetical protein